MIPTPWKPDSKSCNTSMSLWVSRLVIPDGVSVLQLCTLCKSSHSQSTDIQKHFNWKHLFWAVIYNFQWNFIQEHGVPCISQSWVLFLESRFWQGMCCLELIFPQILVCSVYLCFCLKNAAGESSAALNTSFLPTLILG